MRLFFPALLLFPTILFAQLSGTVYDSEKKPLPYATIYVQGTSIGTTTNLDGQYMLDIPTGKNIVIFQYIGYESIDKEINYQGKPIQVAITLSESNLSLPEVIVKADAEDPAYPIIRKAMAKRKFYKERVDAFSCDVYVKGLQKIKDVPDKLMGQEMGDLGGMLDTNRQGVVYFSESVSELFFQAPDQYKEIVHSVKVSGDDSGFGFNSATILTLSLYHKTINLGRPIVSPIAPNAMTYYRYELVGTSYDKSGQVTNKIKLIPKKPETPAFSGYIYINDDLWNIAATDVQLTGKAIKQPILDTLKFQQNYIQVQENDIWLLLSQNLTFDLKIFGIGIAGYFTGMVNNYQLEKKEDDFWDENLFVVQDSANKHDLTHWEKLRPVPLTVEESADYIKKDSLQKVWKSKSFLDSIDHKNNQFKPIHLLAGYTYNRSYQKESWAIGSPLDAFSFNTVQGWTLGTTLHYKKRFGEEERKSLEFELPFDYGFAEQRFRMSGQVTFKKHELLPYTINLSGGLKTIQYNATNPISGVVNELFSTFDNRNYFKIYEKAFVSATYRQRLLKGISFRTHVDFSERRPLVNHSDYSFTESQNQYTSNNPLDPLDDSPAFPVHRAFTVQADANWTPKTKYLKYPKQRIDMGSAWPTFGIHNRTALPLFSTDIQYSKVWADIQKSNIPLGIWGELGFRVAAGQFLNTDSLHFMDYSHFSGNQTFLANPSKYLTSYMSLPYYDYSTTKPYGELHIEHHFKGYFLDKIPLIRKLGWNEVIGFSGLYTEDKQDYFEVNVGLENIGFKLFRIFRVDAVASFKQGKYQNTGVVIGISL